MHDNNNNNNSQFTTITISSTLKQQRIKNSLRSNSCTQINLERWLQITIDISNRQLKQLQYNIGQVIH